MALGKLLTPDDVFLANELLFKSPDKRLKKEYLDWWRSATETMLEFYEQVDIDGSEDALRCRMIAAARLAQLGLNMFNFFGSAAEVIQSGMADQEACGAVSEVVVNMVSRKVESWLESAETGLN